MTLADRARALRQRLAAFAHEGLDVDVEAAIETCLRDAVAEAVLAERELWDGMKAGAGQRIADLQRIAELNCERIVDLEAERDRLRGLLGELLGRSAVEPSRIGEDLARRIRKEMEAKP